MIVCFDTETTSEKPETCRVVQVAAVKFDEMHSERPSAYQVIIDEITDPGMESSDAATAIHGIGPEQWKGKASDTNALERFYSWLESNYMDSHGVQALAVAGHNVSYFDLPILYRITGKQSLFGLPVVDTMLCAQRIYPNAPSHRLTTNPKEPEKTGLIEFLKLGEVEGAHTALGDAMMVKRLVSHFCDGLQKTPLQLAAWCGQPRVLKYCPFGKHKGKLWGRQAGGVPLGYAKFIADNFSPSPDLEATLWTLYGLRFKKRTRGQ